MSSAPQNLKAYIDTVGSALLIFFATIFFIVFIALYVRNIYDFSPTLSDEEIEKNLQPAGNFYLRQ